MKGLIHSIRRLIGIAAGISAVCVMAGCESSGDGWKDMPENYRIDYGEIVTVRSASGSDCYVRRDDDLILCVKRNLVENAVMNSGDRVLVNYFILGDMTEHVPDLETYRGGYNIQLNNLITLPCKDVILRGSISDSEYESMSFDPLLLTGFNVGRHHVDLTIDYYRTPSVEHRFDLLCEKDEQLGIWTFYIAHDAGADGEAVAAETESDYRISFDVSELLTEERQTVKIVWTEYGNRRKEALIVLPAA